MKLLPSLDKCQKRLTIIPNCTLNPAFNSGLRTYNSVGGLTSGHFLGDAAVAGVGVSCAGDEL